MSEQTDPIDVEAILLQLEEAPVECERIVSSLPDLAARLIQVQKQRIQELQARVAYLEREALREMEFGDIYHIPEWRHCMVLDCPVVLHHPNWFCDDHAWGYINSRGRK